MRLMKWSRADRTRSPTTFLAKNPTTRMISSPVRIPVPGIWSISGTNARTTPSTTGENRLSTFWKNQTRRATDTTSGTMTKRPVRKVFFRFLRTVVFYRKLRGGGDSRMDHAVVLAGGSGRRFWPESRIQRSKQFLDLTGAGPMIVETVRRLFPLLPRENVWVVAGEKDAPHLQSRVLGVPSGNILLEPEGRNTAPAVALAVARIERRDADAVLALTPSDHAVGGVGY